MSRTSQERYKKEGKCIFCGGDPRPGVLTCKQCALKASDRQRQKQAVRHQASQCIRCGRTPLMTKYHCASCRKDNHIGMRRVDARIKQEVFAAYGGFVCNCCGETEECFLSIDHINNDGAEHRRRIGNGNCYRWLRDNGFPPGFQVLCMNCQWGKKLRGACPHQTRTP